MTEHNTNVSGGDVREWHTYDTHIIVFKQKHVMEMGN